jgi:hypothetical protein
MSGNQNTLPAMGGITFANNAFPNASQAAFGGMGGAGYGVGYGGQSSGASITFVPAGSQAAMAPSGEGSTDMTSLIMIAGIILAVILVVAMIGGKESHHGRR